ncbi:MAG TPA: PDDEXK nuclease domain-containing protein [Puia sp.]|nr:PDDEXK nuclease domain-containing protein [Puia sp.]
MVRQIKTGGDKQLVNDIVFLIEESKSHIAQTVNSTLTLLYWRIGKRINEEVLGNKRADYGKQVISGLASQLVLEYGNGFSEKSIRRMIQFAEVFPDEQIVVSAIRQLSWTHFIALIPLKDSLQREFYLELCKIEGWNVKTLRQKIDGMLYERTAISKKPDRLIKKELKELREDNKVTPDLIFRDPYFLNFLGLKDTFSEKNIEDAILRELETFILEIGQGFSFIERQKNMIIDGEDFKLDLLFFHRRLRRLVAIELKLGKFKASYKGQMELYLRRLEKHEIQKGEKTPIGLILCAEGNNEQVELLQVDKTGIKVAEYLTELPSKKTLKQKLHQAVELSRKTMENRIEG